VSHRRRARQLTLQILFQADLGRFPVQDVLKALRAERPKEDWPFITLLCTGVVEQRDALDRVIAAHLIDWTLDRLAAVDRNILRMALYELRQMDTPASVVISEAVELAKTYGGEESGRFVNGILGAVQREGPHAGPSGVEEPRPRLRQ
jgi:N utilization substance protein B